MRRTNTANKRLGGQQLRSAEQVYFRLEVEVAHYHQVEEGEVVRHPVVVEVAH
jgi:hypothetical protein